MFVMIVLARVANTFLALWLLVDSIALFFGGELYYGLTGLALILGIFLFLSELGSGICDLLGWGPTDNYILERAAMTAKYFWLLIAGFLFWGLFANKTETSGQALIWGVLGVYLFVVNVPLLIYHKRRLDRMFHAVGHV